MQFQILPLSLSQLASPHSSGLKISLDPNSQYTFHIVYIPSSISLQHSYMDILDTVHDRKYKVY